MRVLLINPNSPYLDNPAAYPPVGLLYVASALDKAGCGVDVLDLATDSRRIDDLNKTCNAYDLVGITCVTPNVNTVTKLVSKIDSDIPVMVGGPHPTWLPHETVDVTHCTFAVSGEIETVANEIVSDVRKEQIKKVYHAAMPPLSDIGKPSRRLVNLHNYKPGGENATPVYTSRGCPFRCNFCSKVSLNTYRSFPISQTIEEVRECIGYGFRKIVFGDDNLAINPRKLTMLCDAMKLLDIEFRLNMDARHNNHELFHKAAGAGCTDISFGIESGSQSMLNAMNKDTVVAKNYEAIRMTQEADMKARAYFMVNFPGETEHTVKETLAFAEKTQPDSWLLSAFAPLPGSPVWNSPQRFGITNISKNWDDFYLVGKGGKFKPCFETEYLTAEKQVELHQMMYEGLKEILG